MAFLKFHSRHWIVDENDRIIMGEGRQEILENIERTGSLNQTAKIMRMSYKGVWGKIKATEKYLKVRVVDADRKRGTSLTKEGKILLEKYKLFREQCTKENKRIFEGIFNQATGPGRGEQK